MWHLEILKNKNWHEVVTENWARSETVLSLEEKDWEEEPSKFKCVIFGHFQEETMTLSPTHPLLNLPLSYGYIGSWNLRSTSIRVCRLYFLKVRSSLKAQWWLAAVRKPLMAWMLWGGWALCVSLVFPLSCSSGARARPRLMAGVRINKCTRQTMRKPQAIFRLIRRSWWGTGKVFLDGNVVGF